MSKDFLKVRVRARTNASLSLAQDSQKGMQMTRKINLQKYNLFKIPQEVPKIYLKKKEIIGAIDELYLDKRHSKQEPLSRNGNEQEERGSIKLNAPQPKSSSLKQMVRREDNLKRKSLFEMDLLRMRQKDKMTQFYYTMHQ